MRPRLFLPALLLAACTPPASRASVGAARAAHNERRTIEAVVADSFFGAVARRDEAGVRRHATASFALASDSAQMTAEDYLARARRVLDRGTRLSFAFREWNTTVHGDVAWTTYRAVGTFTTGTVANRLEWHETAVLVRGGDSRWRVDRLHSTTVARTSGAP